MLTTFGNQCTTWEQLRLESAFAVSTGSIVDFFKMMNEKLRLGENPRVGMLAMSAERFVGDCPSDETSTATLTKPQHAIVHSHAQNTADESKGCQSKIRGDR